MFGSRDVPITVTVPKHTQMSLIWLYLLWSECKLLKNSINIERVFDFSLILKLHFNVLYPKFYK